MLPVKTLQQVGRVRMALSQEELDEIRENIRAEVRDEMLRELKRDFLAEMPEAPQRVQEICASVDRWASLKIAQEANKALDEEAEDDPNNTSGKSPRFASAANMAGEGEPEEMEAPFGLSLRMSLKGKSREELVKMNEGAKLAGDKMVRLSTEAAIREMDEHEQGDKIVAEMFKRNKQPV